VALLRLNRLLFTWYDLFLEIVCQFHWQCLVSFANVSRIAALHFFLRRHFFVAIPGACRSTSGASICSSTRDPLTTSTSKRGELPRGLKLEWRVVSKSLENPQCFFIGSAALLHSSAPSLFHSSSVILVGKPVAFTHEAAFIHSRV